MEENIKTGLHKLNLVDRQTLSATGISKVNSSNPNCVSLKLKDTDLLINGTNLNIVHFNDNAIEIVGMIDTIKYSKQSQTKTGLFKRIFK